MARLITELTAAGAVTPASDLLWIEQSSAPRKITVNDLVSAGTPASHNHAASEITSGVLSAPRMGSTYYTVAPTAAIMERARWGAVYDMDLIQEPGQYGGYNTMTNGPTGFTYDPFWVGASASDVSSLLVVPRTASRGLAWRGETSDVVTAWHYSGWTLTAADADLTGYLKKSGGTMTGSITVDNQEVAGAIISSADGAVWRGGYPSLGTTYSAASTYLSNNAYVDPGDTVSNQYRTAITHASYGHTIYQMAAGIHYWYGNNNSVTAGNVVTKQENMTLSAGGRLEVRERIYPGNNATGYIDGPTTRGSINVNGAQAGSYSGYSISNNLIFMYNGTAGGIYDEVQDEWKLRFDTNATGVILYADGVPEMQMQNSDTTANTSGAQVKDHQQTYRDVGFNHVKEILFNASDTLEDIHAGCILNKTGSGTVVLTLAADSQFPNGSMCTVLNHGTGGSLTISDGSEAMYIMDGSGTVTDNTGFVLAVAGVITIWRKGTSAYYVWGAGIP